MSRIHCRSLLLLLLSVLAPAAVFGNKVVKIHVNKKPVELASMQQAILSDEVFVSARQFAESAGAKVDYDAAKGTLTVTSPRGTGILKLGSHWGRINGTKVWFPEAPYSNGGQFYSPMLFFNDLWDQAWYWDPFYQQFKWIPIFPRYRGQSRPPMFIPGPGRPSGDSQSAPQQQPQAQSGTGAMVRPLPSQADPKVVVQVGSRAATYPVAKDAVILRGKVGSQATEVALSSIRPGDKITFQRNSQGKITLIRAMYKQVSGKISSISVDTITLDSGDNLRLGAQTNIFLPDNTMGMPQDLMVGDALSATIDPDTGDAYVIQVQPRISSAPSGPDDDKNPIAVNSWGPLNVGDVLIVRFKNSPGGKAWFTIPGVQANAPMVEVSPGVYQSSYVIQQGDVALRQPIKVTFVAADGSTYTRLSSRAITIHSLTDYMPRITNPRQGQQIQSPVVVSGQAQPGSVVRVVIEFRRIAQGFYPLQGTTAIQDVQADAQGHWTTPPLAAVAPASDSDYLPPLDLGVFTDIWTWRDRERPTVYTITAVSIGPNGEEKASYHVDVTKTQSQSIGGLTSPLVELKAGSAGG